MSSEENTGRLPAIADLDDWLRQLTEGLPPVPRQYEFRCHPDVFAAIREAADAEPRYVPDGSFIYASPVFGGANVLVQSELGSGRWELYENGELLKSGRVGYASSSPGSGSAT
jgi:hypothetical protein